ncbi:hypothetical protein [Nonomuraea turcica]|uniref:hypothetical protein n=1 Tax=Nonomuraea sp. G32 TaxID=3067274 RepID=UPI00273A9A93|nr:hypothetical protein [Nonomuraea sp. G32]MDP4505323.1 hypothetical protein [Nonomuraea sp. G32]
MTKNLPVMISMAAIAGVLTTLPGGTAQAATSGATSAPAAQGARQTAIKHKASIKCTRPKGAKTNYSWGDGSMSVTVYFNNHCSHQVRAKLHIKNSIGGNFTKCLVTNGGTKGRKKFNIGLASTLTEITKGC